MSTHLETKQTEHLRLSNEESNRLTRECLQTALIYLLNEKGLDEITITELVKRSGVSRTAFYRNYNTKEDILQEISDRIFSDLRDSLSNSYYIQNPRQWLVDFFTKASENAVTLQMLLQMNHPIKLPYAPELPEQLFPHTTLRDRYTIVALEGAISGIFRHWFLNGRQESPEEIADLCIQILTTDPII